MENRDSQRMKDNMTEEERKQKRKRLLALSAVPLNLLDEFLKVMDNPLDESLLLKSYMEQK